MKLTILLISWLAIGLGLEAQDEYRTIPIKPGDVVHISVWREPDLTRKVEVGQDGRLHLPLLGAIRAEGLNLDQLTQQCERDYARYINKPRISITFVKRPEPRP